MYGTGIPSTPPPEKPKTPVLGIISCVTAVLSICLGCSIFVALYALGSQYATPGSFDPNNIDIQAVSGYVLVIFALICGSGLSALVGIGTGIASAVVDKNKLLGIIGLVISSLVFLGECGFFAFSWFVGT